MRRGDCRRNCRKKAAAATICLFSFYPLQITYANSALTEIYVFATLAAVTLNSTIPARISRFILAKDIDFALLVATGYHIRQTMLILAPAAALVLLLQVWRHGLLIAMVGVILILSLPLAAKAPFDRYVKNAAVKTYMLRQGMIRQALIPEEHPFVAADKQKHRYALTVSGNMLSGIRSDLIGQIAETVYPRMGEPFSDFVTLAFENPWRYGSALARTTALYMGFQQNRRQLCQRIKTPSN